MADGMFGDFMGSLGQGFQSAGAILSDPVYQNQNREREQGMVQRQQMALQVMSGIQNGSIPPEQGKMILQKLQMPDVGMGPTPQAQGAQQNVDLNKMFLGQMGGQQQAPQVPGMVASGLTGGQSSQPQIPQFNPASLSPMGQAYMKQQQQQAQIDLERKRIEQVDKQLKQGPFNRLNPKDYTPESLKAFQKSSDVSDLVAAVKDTRATQEWSEPYNLQGAMVQKNASTGEIRTAVSREPRTTINMGDKGWTLGTAGGSVVRVNANMGSAEKQNQDGSWTKVPIPPDYVPTSASSTVNPDAVNNTAQLIASYNMPPMSGWAMARPQGSAIMSKVKEINPDYDATVYYRKNRAEGDMGAGKTAQLTRSFNVFIQHTGVMREAAEALANNDIQALNFAGNKIAQYTGKPAPTTFDAVKKIYGDELVKAIVGTGGNVSDREAAAEAINRTQSPEQMVNVMNHYNKLISGQVLGVKTQYTAATMKGDFDSFLLPETKKELAKYGYSSDSTGLDPKSGATAQGKIKFLGFEK